MKFLKRFLTALAILVGLILVVAIFLPSKVHIEDSTTINASANVIFPKVNNLSVWEKWSPFQKADPAMTSVYSGPVEGVGSSQAWKSPKNGDGSLTIMESVPYQLINMKLVMMENSQSMSNWKFEPEGMGTKVTWSVDIENLGYPLERLFALFMPSMMHESFQSGLADLKTLCEKEYTEMMKYKTGDITISEVGAWNAIAIKDSSSCDKISEVMGSVFGEVQDYMDANKIECVGPPYALYYMWDEKANKFVMEAGMPVKGKPVVTGRMKLIEYPAVKAVAAVHYGAYETLYNTYMALEKYIKNNNLKQKGMPWEVYVTDPETQPDMSKWETMIYYPVE